MTLQDFKDQVAQKTVAEYPRKIEYRDFAHVVEHAHEYGMWDDLLSVSDRAAELYAKEREKEATRDLREILERVHSIMEHVPEYEGSAAMPIVLAAIAKYYPKIIQS